MRNGTDSSTRARERRATWRRLLAAAAAGIILTGWNRAGACGPDFPNWLLSEGDNAVLVAPEGNFAAELERMKLGPAHFRSVPPEERQSYAAESLEAELADLRKALKQNGTASEEATRICREHQHQRQQLAAFLESREAWKRLYDRSPEAPEAPDQATPTDPKPVLPVMAVVEGLPGEFADYFQGLIVWRNPAVTDKEAARGNWERVLARPEAERRYKSTWAAFMLGRSWETADPEKAIGYFKQVRELAQKGFRDSLGLAAASLGWEARARLQQTNYEAAIELYLEQMATGDPTTTNSLREAAADALTAAPAVLRRLAKNPRTQEVITAYVLSRGHYDSVYGSQGSGSDEPPAATESAAARWLKAAEAAGTHDMDSVEALALAAYRANDMAAAQRWIRRAPETPLTQWLQAKLLVRAGKLQSAAALLAKVRPLFPIIHETTNAPAPADRKDTLLVGGTGFGVYHVSAERQVQGELGVLRLARGEYAQAVDLLLNAGFWMDAAYVAERVLTLEELKHYVDSFWPPVSAEQEAEERDRFGSREVCPAELRQQIRYLLARRLTRELHGDQARAYYPAEWVGAFDQLASQLRTGWDESKPATERAEALLQAAFITRTNGMELLGTEGAPDWHYHLGDFDYGVMGEERGTNAQAVVVRPLPDELQRNAQHAPDPERRFHYRYQAAELAWQAAKLLPDNNDRTAYILWQGGTFLKYRDPQAADRFYKALVRRNRQTALGAEADRQRWFPVLDENGNVVPKPAHAKPQEPPPEGPGMSEPANEGEAMPEQTALVPPAESESVTGYNYVLQAGDSLSSIAYRFTHAGVVVTTRDLLQANPGLDGARLLIGQRIFVPFKGQ